MPVPRARGRDDRVDYVIVRRTVLGDDGSVGEVVDQALDSRSSPSQTVNDILGPWNERRDDDDYDSDDYDSKPPPPPILVTMTIPQAQATGTALADNDPSETVVVTFSPPPKPPPPPHHKGGISQTTEHLLIAAGSIVILAIHTMRKRGLTFAEAVKQGKYQVTRRGPPPPPKRSARWDKPMYSNDYGSMRSNAVTAPEPTLARTGSNSSQRPLLMAPSRNGSVNRQASPPGSAFQDVEGQSFLLDSPPSRNNSHRRSHSGTPSSPVLPLQNQRRSVSTRNTRSTAAESELRYPEPPIERALSPLPPPPTFKQFLSNRRSVAARPGIGPMISRFSWTNSNAPQTPHDPNRDTNSHTISRDSFMTQRSSVPRFRTVDSWVNQQANRLEEQKLKDQLRFTQSTMFSVDDDRDVPEVPMLPKNVDELRESAGTPINNTNASSAAPSPPKTPQNLMGGLPGKNIKHERHDTRTTVETAPIFRQHPGQEVRFSTRSLVPSEILNTKMKPSVL
ncbi:uncharacterized protein BDR25DRAFT_315765 [Lindgomyces ingoldianus]|uniref:Uncharacterized protein n=1 Tax=Lindgomyces ingoldianus TaxID=673940 RepID=A0ACB6QR71_9PLEO|nr:uncharacterized protein BDR25DRAFT_315765 [Lindgomyces ingoldianus]KAF2468792.1 hypothetical protein BDR25DRAFT_315765 [Lindgomyces ingoldianus]